jgi:hypothetical protein
MMSKKTIFVRTADMAPKEYVSIQSSKGGFTPERDMGDEVFGHLGQMWVAVEKTSWENACKEWEAEEGDIREKEIEAIKARILSEYLKNGKAGNPGNVDWARTAAVKIYDMIKKC